MGAQEQDCHSNAGATLSDGKWMMVLGEEIAVWALDNQSGVATHVWARPLKKGKESGELGDGNIEAQVAPTEPFHFDNGEAMVIGSNEVTLELGDDPGDTDAPTYQTTYYPTVE